MKKNDRTLLDDIKLINRGMEVNLDISWGQAIIIHIFCDNHAELVSA